MFPSVWRKIFINIFIWSNFNYCPFVWSISSTNSLLNEENLLKRALRFLHNDYSSSYQELLKMSGKTTINICNYRTLCNEILKTLNNINPSFVKEIFRLRIMNRPTWEKYKLTLEIKVESSKIWNKMFEILWFKSLELFAKNHLKTWVT